MKNELKQDEPSRNVMLEDLREENARLRGDLRAIATRISHDLRTPLGGIIHTGELLKEILAEEKSEALPVTGSLFTSVDDLTKLIGQLRIITKAAADPKQKEHVNMGLIVDGALARLEKRTREKQATITSPDTWPEVNGVPDWLEFIWMNLLTNALQHAGEKPQIKLGWRKEAGGFHFQVCDNGGGVSPATAAKLFQPFDTLDQPGSTRGLGLSISQRLAAMQGGSCGHTPTKGRGLLLFHAARLRTSGKGNNEFLTVSW